ncbi:MAG: nitrilase family protein [Prevotellaceae bacterium]|jgi:predicted amidohydrolase|nr:nitrilase family protein [Prevotellaceae bacterium]
MKLAIVQDEIRWADKSANLQKTADQLSALAGKAELVVLPEMFTTGFTTDRLDLAETMNGPTVDALKKWAVDFRLAITGSFIAEENGYNYNRGFFAFPSGEMAIADKRHLFTPAKEDDYFTGGNKRLTVRYNGFNICVLICYDLRFPVWARNVNNEYDLLIYVANFPAKRIGDWDILLRARAIENQAYVCGVNRTGVDGLDIPYNGHSVLLDYKANELLSFHDNETAVKTAEISTVPLDNYRKKFAVWKDADRFTIA